MPKKRIGVEAEVRVPVPERRIPTGQTNVRETGEWVECYSYPSYAPP